MTTAEYEALTGITVTDEARVDALIGKTQATLEALLGYSLTDSGENFYNEIGKTSLECPCPNIDSDNLLPPDVPGDYEILSYRLYSYNHKDKYVAVDPFTVIRSVKLVKDGITLKTFEDSEYRVHYKNGFAKYLEMCDGCFCQTDCTNCVQLAVDAEWLEAPLDLQYVWADMVTFYNTENHDIKSETLGSHSYTRFDNTAPESLENNLVILAKYVGPNGSLYRSLTW